jgi:hypothetical protein
MPALAMPPFNDKVSCLNAITHFPRFDSLLVWAAIGRLIDEPDRMIGGASAPSSAAMDRIDNVVREHLVSLSPLLALATHS